MVYCAGARDILRLRLSVILGGRSLAMRSAPVLQMQVRLNLMKLHKRLNHSKRLENHSHCELRGRHGLNAPGQNLKRAAVQWLSVTTANGDMSRCCTDCQSGLRLVSVTILIKSPSCKVPVPVPQPWDTSVLWPGLGLEACAGGCRLLLCAPPLSSRSLSFTPFSC